MEPREEPSMDFPTQRKDLSPEEVNDAIIDAYERGDMKEVERLRKEYLGESLTLSYRAWVILNS
jgi:hypothetical protein